MVVEQEKWLPAKYNDFVVKVYDFAAISCMLNMLDSISPLKNNLHIKLRRNRDFCKLLWLADILDFFFGAFACAWRRIIGEGCSGELDFRLILILIRAFCCLTLMIETDGRSPRSNPSEMVLKVWRTFCGGREAERLGLRALFCLFFPPLVDVLDFLSSESAKVTLLFERLMRLPVIGAKIAAKT